MAEDPYEKLLELSCHVWCPLAPHITTVTNDNLPPLICQFIKVWTVLGFLWCPFTTFVLPDAALGGTLDHQSIAHLYLVPVFLLVDSCLVSTLLHLGLNQCGEAVPLRSSIQSLGILYFGVFQGLVFLLLFCRCTLLLCCSTLISLHTIACNILLRCRTFLATWSVDLFACLPKSKEPLPPMEGELLCCTVVVWAVGGRAGKLMPVIVEEDVWNTGNMCFGVFACGFLLQWVHPSNVESDHVSQWTVH